MADMNWIIEVNEDLNRMEGAVEGVYLQTSSRHCRHKQEGLQAPDSLLRPSHFLKRCGKPVELFADALAEVVEDLKDSYNPLEPVWRDNTARFLQLMFLDGCFMLEILRTASHILDDYAPTDPIFSKHGKFHVMPFIKRDMLMLENQLPMLVLVKLVAVETDKAKDEESVNRLIVKFCCSCTVPLNMGKCVHVWDVYRKSLLQEDPHQKIVRHRASVNGSAIIWSATELKEAGIRFKKSKSASLKDISFSGGILKLPLMVVDDSTESMFLNMIAFERFHVGAGNEVTSYIFFMDSIIDNHRDVGLLQSKGIIHNFLGSDDAVAKLLNSLSKDITLDPDCSLDKVHKSVYHYCKKPWNNEWRANLIQTYFRNPWAIISLFAAILLFVLTIAQTVTQVMDEIAPSSPEPGSPPPPMVSSNRA